MAVFLSDTFTEASDTALSSHAPEIGGTWANHPSDPDGMTVVASEGRARGDSATSTSVYYNDAVPGSPEYDVEATIRHDGTDRGFVGLLARVQAGSTTFYQVYYDHGGAPSRIVLERVIGGSAIQLGRHDVGLSTNTDYQLKLEIRDAAKKVYLDNVEILSSTDNSITAAGFAGIRARLGSRIDDLVANDTTAAGVTATPTGVEGTGEVGTVSVSTSTTVALTGLEAAGEVGTVTASAGIIAAPQGVSASADAGTVSIRVDATATVAGVQGEGETGSVTVAGAGDATVAVSGVSASGEVGSAQTVFGVTVSVSGVFATGETGTVEGPLQWEIATSPAETWVTVGEGESIWDEGASIWDEGLGVVRSIWDAGLTPETWTQAARAGQTWTVQ